MYKFPISRSKSCGPLGFLATTCIFLFYVFPILMELKDKPADPVQYKCSQPNHDPAADARPILDRIATIEITNGGQFANRCQLTDVLYDIAGKRSPGQRPYWKTDETGRDLDDKPWTVLLYIHGWRNDADSKDRVEFEKLVQQIRINSGESRYIYGVYIAWNAAWHLGWADLFSFWAKKSVADQISQSGTITNIISLIGSMRRNRKNEPISDKFIVLGHSFGARILISSVMQPFVYETQRAHPDSLSNNRQEQNSSRKFELIEGSADGVILINPAFEASIFSVVDSVHRDEENFSPSQPPLLVSISSKADDATRWAFAFGRLITGYWKRTAWTTLGHYRPYRTHELKKSAKEECVDKWSTLSENYWAAGICLSRRETLIRQAEYKFITKKGRKGCKKRDFQPYNPFIVARTYSDIVPGHSDIWGDDFKKWLEMFISDLGKFDPSLARQDRNAARRETKPFPACDF